MHGSGTSIVSRVLQELGVYMGHDLDHHAEAGEFFDLNEELLHRAGAAWQHAEPFLACVSGGTFVRSAAWRAAAATFGSLRTGYLRHLHSAVAWGWKDPRNSLTLPVWLQLFPNARVIHVMREKEAAAASIHRRAHRQAEAGIGRGGVRDWRQSLARLAFYPPAAFRAVGRRLGRVEPFPEGDPCLSLDYCRRLADMYISSCLRWRDQGGPRLEVSYERLLKEPGAVVGTLAAFAVGDADAERMRAASALVGRPADWIG